MESEEDDDDDSEYSEASEDSDSDGTFEIIALLYTIYIFTLYIF